MRCRPQPMRHELFPVWRQLQPPIVDETVTEDYKQTKDPVKLSHFVPLTTHADERAKEEGRRKPLRPRVCVSSSPFFLRPSPLPSPLPSSPLPDHGEVRVGPAPAFERAAADVQEDRRDGDDEQGQPEVGPAEDPLLQLDLHGRPPASFPL